MPLERSVVFRQLDGGGRFGRITWEDALLPLLATTVAYYGMWIFDYHPLYMLVVFASSFTGGVVARRRFPDGLLSVLLFLLQPKHRSAHAPDRLAVPYPARPERREGDRI